MTSQNKKTFITYLCIVGAILIILNVVSRNIFFRWDLTDNKMYSLSESSKSVVGKIDDRLTMKVYFSDNLPGEYGNNERYLQDILEEYAAYSNGNIYFTDPGARVLPYDREIDFSGIFMVDSDGSLSLATDECEYPNGLAFSPDESVMYVAISRLNGDCIKNKADGNVCKHQFIRAFDVEPDGSLSNNRVFAELFSSEEGVPDGIKVDVEGRVYCTGPGGCWVYEPNGSLIGIIKMPEVPANVAFGGTDWKDLYFTARTSIYMFRAKCAGIKVPA